MTVKLNILHMLTAIVLAASVLSQNCIESQKQVYMEWRNLTPLQKQQYFAAINCLKGKPAQVSKNMFSGLSQHTSRMDDFVYAYYRANLETPFAIAEAPNSPFFPFHRTIVRLYDQALTKECGYQGPFPYWDWSLDSGSPRESQVWNDFGGSTACLDTKPLPFWTTHYRRLKKQEWETAIPIQKIPCVSRFNVDKLGQYITPKNVLDTLGKENYDKFQHAAQTMVWNLHRSIGGDIGGIDTALADPLAFLSFRNADRLWANWQARGNNANQYYGGRLVKTGAGVHSKMVTIDDKVDVYGLFPVNIQVKDVMSINSGAFGGLMCYKYIKPSVKVFSIQQMINFVKHDLRALWNPA